MMKAHYFAPALLLLTINVGCGSSQPAEETTTPTANRTRLRVRSQPPAGRDPEFRHDVEMICQIPALREQMSNEVASNPELAGADVSMVLAMYLEEQTQSERGRELRTQMVENQPEAARLLANARGESGYAGPCPWEARLREGQNPTP